MAQHLFLSLKRKRVRCGTVFAWGASSTHNKYLYIKFKDNNVKMNNCWLVGWLVIQLGQLNFLDYHCVFHLKMNAVIWKILNANLAFPAQILYTSNRKWFSTMPSSFRYGKITVLRTKQCFHSQATACIYNWCTDLFQYNAISIVNDCKAAVNFLTILVKFLMNGMRGG